MAARAPGTLQAGGSASSPTEGRSRGRSRSRRRGRRRPGPEGRAHGPEEDRERPLLPGRPRCCPDSAGGERSSRAPGSSRQVLHSAGPPPRSCGSSGFSPGGGDQRGREGGAGAGLGDSTVATNQGRPGYSLTPAREGQVRASAPLFLHTRAGGGPLELRPSHVRRHGAAPSREPTHLRRGSSWRRPGSRGSRAPEPAPQPCRGPG